MKQFPRQRRSGWFWAGVILLAMGAMGLLLCLLVDLEGGGEWAIALLLFVAPFVIPGIFCVMRSRKAVTPTVSQDVQQGPRPALRFLLGFLILMLAVGSMIAVAVLLMTYNESLGWVVIFMSIAFIPVLATKLRSSVQSIRQREEKRRDLERIEQHMRQKVLEEPGISHTGLCRSVEGNRDLKELAIAQLLDHGELKCEQRDRGRKYFVG